MANEQNLIPFTSDQSREEAKKNGAKGGKASVRSRNFRKALDELLSGKVLGEKQNQMLDLMNVEEGSRDHWRLVLARIILDAEAGNTGAQRLLLEYSGERPADKQREEEIRLRREMFEYQKNGNTNTTGNELMESLIEMEKRIHDTVE